MTIAPSQTPRLILRPFTDADIPVLLPLIGAREVAATTLRISHPYTEQHARDFLAKTRREDEIHYAVTLRSDGGLCGGIGLRIEAQHVHAELGYWLGAAYWGKGYATEACLSMLRYGFEELKLHRILASHFKRNGASGNVLKKVGMRYEGCMREHLLKWDEFIDVECYGILRAEWEENRKLR
jgi:RimJ/RimL family protein N-acetyltransferase